mgnify:CR=1 FL=1
MCKTLVIKLEDIKNQILQAYSKSLIFTQEGNNINEITDRTTWRPGLFD